MKILLDARMYGTEYTGIGRYIQNLVTYLQKIDKENQYFILLRTDKYKSLNLNNNWQKIEADYRHYSLKEQFLLPQKLKSIEFDLAHFPHFNVPLIFNKPFVVTLHDVTMHKQSGKNATTLPTFFYTLKRFGYYKVFNHSVEKSSNIIVPTKYVKNDVKKRYKNIASEKIHVIHEGLDELVRPVKNKEKEYKNKFKKIISDKYFVYAGNAYPHKNLERLIESFAYLVEDSKFKVKLVIITKKNKFRTELEKIVKVNNLSKHVEFYQNLTDDELGYLYSKSQAFVYPSIEEGFGLQGLEAIGNNTLLLASDIEVFREVYDKKAIYFNPHDFSSIQSAMFDVLNLSADQRKLLLKKQREILEKYSLQKMAKSTLKIYEAI